MRANPGLTPSIPLSARGSLETVTAVGGEGEEGQGVSPPQVEEVASCDLFYLGLFVCHPYRGSLRNAGFLPAAFVCRAVPYHGVVDIVYEGKGDVARTVKFLRPYLI